MKKEVNLNLQDDQGFTVLHHAVQDNNIEAVKYLINSKNLNYNVNILIT